MAFSLLNTNMLIHRNRNGILCKSHSSRTNKYSYSKFQRQQHELFELNDKIDKAIRDAIQICDTKDSAKSCAVAWDIVEELSKANANINKKIDADIKSNLDEYKCTYLDDPDDLDYNIRLYDI